MYFQNGVNKIKNQCKIMFLFICGLNVSNMIAALRDDTAVICETKVLKCWICFDDLSEKNADLFCRFTCQKQAQAHKHVDLLHQFHRKCIDEEVIKKKVSLNCPFCNSKKIDGNFDIAFPEHLKKIIVDNNKMESQAVVEMVDEVLSKAGKVISKILCIELFRLVESPRMAEIFLKRILMQRMYEFLHEDWDVLKLLINIAGVNVQNGDGNTLLSLASLAGNREFAKLLLSIDGIHVIVQNNNNDTPLSLASDKGYRDIVMMLLEADIEKKVFVCGIIIDIRL